jgi:pimeloyl-ACP methyl ester carboxylesterase
MTTLLAALDVILAVLGAAGLLLLLWAATALWITFRHRIPALPDERHVAVTRDGWLLSLYRYRPRADGPGRGPVFLCHGLLANQANHDLDDRRSLARYLAGAGFDAWGVELRGSGRSRDAEGRRGLARITFDDYVERDIPAALETIRKETGSQEIQWVGHSMGGMLLYAYLSCREDPGILSGVTVGSPVDFRALARTARPMLALRPLLRLSRVPIGLILRGFLPLIALSRSALVRVGLVPSNLRPGDFGDLLVNVIEPFGPPGVLGQFAEWVEEGVFVSRDRRRAYDSLRHLHCPLLVIAASRDLIAPADSVRPAVALAPAREKVYRLFGTASGDDREYGHGDVLLSDPARKQVFPLISDWLTRHAPRPPAS